MFIKNMRCFTWTLLKFFSVLLVTISPGVLSSPNGEASACEDARVLSDNTRHFSVTSINDRCDSDLTLGWYRFELNGRHAEIPTTCIMNNHCGTQVPLHLDTGGSDLPQLNQTVKFYVCASYNVLGKWDCCVLRKPVYVKNCGDHFVYYLTPPDRCPVGYCAQVSNNPPFTNTTVKTGEHVHTSTNTEQSSSDESGTTELATISAYSSTTSSNLTDHKTDATAINVTEVLNVSTTVGTSSVIDSVVTELSNMTTSLSNVSTPLPSILTSQPSSLVVNLTSGYTILSTLDSSNATSSVTFSPTPTPALDTSSQDTPDSSTSILSSTYRSATATVLSSSTTPRMSEDFSNQTCGNNSTRFSCGNNTCFRLADHVEILCRTKNASIGCVQACDDYPECEHDEDEHTNLCPAIRCAEGQQYCPIINGCLTNCNDVSNIRETTFNISGANYSGGTGIVQDPNINMGVQRAIIDSLNNFTTTRHWNETNVSIVNITIIDVENAMLEITASINVSQIANRDGFMDLFGNHTFISMIESLVFNNTVSNTTIMTTLTTEGINTTSPTGYSSSTTSSTSIENRTITTTEIITLTSQTDTSTLTSSQTMTTSTLSQTTLTPVESTTISSINENQTSTVVTHPPSLPSTLQPSNTQTSTGVMTSGSTTQTSTITPVSSVPSQNMTRSSVISSTLVVENITTITESNITNSPNSSPITEVYTISPYVTTEASQTNTTGFTTQPSTTVGVFQSSAIQGTDHLSTSETTAGIQSTLSSTSITSTNVSTQPVQQSSSYIATSTITTPQELPSTTVPATSESTLPERQSTSTSLPSLPPDPSVSTTLITLPPSPAYQTEPSTTETEPSTTETQITSEQRTLFAEHTTIGSTAAVVQSTEGIRTARPTTEQIISTTAEETTHRSTQPSGSSSPSIQTSTQLPSTSNEELTMVPIPTTSPGRQTTVPRLPLYTSAEPRMDDHSSQPTKLKSDSTESMIQFTTNTEWTMTNTSDNITSGVLITEAPVEDADHEIVAFFKQNIGLFIFLIVASVAMLGICLFGVAGTIYQRRMRTWSPEVTLDDTYPDMEKSMISIGREGPGIESPIPDVDILQSEQTGEGESVSKASTLVCRSPVDRLQGTSTGSADTPIAGSYKESQAGYPSLNGHANEAYQSDESIDLDGVTPYDELDQQNPRNMFPWIDTAEDTKV